jgi:hypothetical protein
MKKQHTNEGGLWFPQLIFVYECPMESKVHVSLHHKKISNYMCQIYNVYIIYTSILNLDHWIKIKVLAN